MVLPKPKQLAKMDPIRFSVEASLVHRLGEESVSDQVLSLIELIKNSYDADATEVTVILRNLRTGAAHITIADDGSGMTLEELQRGWMRVATSIKSESRVSPIFHRQMLGQKGIGRFAIENLSERTTLSSYPRNSTEGYRVSFEWTKYQPRADLLAIPNEMVGFQKPQEIHGLEIQLDALRHRWTEQDIQRLWQFIRSLTPPAEIAMDFRVVVDTDEFQDLAGEVKSDFLEKAVFIFDARLAKTGEIKYQVEKHGEGVIKQKTGRIGDFSCGPVDFKLYFYYRDKSKLRANGVIVEDIDTIRKLLDNYGGIKVYRDGIRLSGFGNPDDDWTGLDAMARNDPTVVPARDQILAMVRITSSENPDITDTTTRENIIKNQSFQDLLKFVKDSIGVFAQMRGEVEKKRQAAPSQPNRYIQEARQRIQQNRSRKALLDFADQYPLVFYKNLEEEINIAYTSSLPNAGLVLGRKLVENLLYNILEEKFPKELGLRYIEDGGRAQDFSVLIDSLETKMAEFNREQRDVIVKFLALVKPFKRDANSKAHKVMDYLESVDELEKLKITEIVQFQLYLLKKIKSIAMQATT